METSSKCYLNTGNGEPQYNVVIHEIGHNFAVNSKGMNQLLYSNRSKINNAGFGECVASLPVIYIASEIYNNPEKYGYSKDDFEWRYYKIFLKNDKIFAGNRLDEFEDMIQDADISGIFDTSKNFDRVSYFCSFFQKYSYGLTQTSNPHGNKAIKRFLNLFSNNELENFKEDKVETFFAAAYSAAVGSDQRAKLRFWGFNIDDAYFNESYPIFVNRLNN